MFYFVGNKMIKNFKDFTFFPPKFISLKKVKEPQIATYEQLTPDDGYVDQS